MPNKQYTPLILAELNLLNNAGFNKVRSYFNRILPNEKDRYVSSLQGDRYLDCQRELNVLSQAITVNHIQKFSGLVQQYELQKSFFNNDVNKKDLKNFWLKLFNTALENRAVREQLRILANTIKEVCVRLEMQSKNVDTKIKKIVIRRDKAIDHRPFDEEIQMLRKRQSVVLKIGHELLELERNISSLLKKNSYLTREDFKQHYQQCEAYLDNQDIQVFREKNYTLKIVNRMKDSILEFINKRIGLQKPLTTDGMLKTFEKTRTQMFKLMRKEANRKNLQLFLE